MMRRRKKSGFSLVEMMVTIALLAIVVLAVTPNLQKMARHEKEMQLYEALRSLRQAIDAYKDATMDGRIALPVGQSGYPPTLSLLVKGVTNMRDPNGAKLYFLRRIPRDPFNTNPYLSNEETWQHRSYESSAEHPMPGSDVFDVSSRSIEIGLNGIPYKDW